MSGQPSNHSLPSAVVCENMFLLIHFALPFSRALIFTALSVELAGGDKPLKFRKTTHRINSYVIDDHRSSAMEIDRPVLKGRSRQLAWTTSDLNRVKAKEMRLTKEIKVIETTVVEYSQISRISTVRITPRKFTRFD